MFRYFKMTALLVTLVLGAMFSEPAAAQDAMLVISKSSDFSTFDRNFSREDTLYVRVLRPDIDFTSIDEMRYHLRPRHEGPGIAGLFTNNFDGSYTTSMGLDQLDSTAFEWVLKLEIEDRLGNEFSIKVDIRIGEENPDFRPGHRFGIEGRVRALGTDSLMVRDLWLVINDSTRFFAEGATDASFDDLFPGARVSVLAHKRDHGPPLATHVKMDLNQDVVAVGRITHVDSATITVDGLSFEVVEETEVRGRLGQPVAFDSLHVGMFARVEGRVRSDGVLWAKRIRILNQAPEEKLEVSGEIESVTDSSVTVSGYEFQLHEHTRIVVEHHFEIGRIALIPGADVEVLAIVHPDSSLWAVLIKVEHIPGVEIEEKGEIEEVGSDFLVVNGTEFLLLPETLVFNSDRRRSDRGLLQPGLPVLVKGLELDDGSTVALVVMARKRLHERVKRTGRIQSMTDHSLTVFGATFEVDSTTVVLDEHSMVADFDTLQLNMLVTVHGYWQNSGILFAEEIKMRRRAGDGVEVKAIIDSLELEWIHLAGLKFLVTDQTRVVDESKNPMDYSQLAPGQFVQIHGRRLPDGVNIALRIRLRDQAEDHFELFGSISHIGGDTLVVEGRNVLTTAETEFTDRHETPLTLSDFSVGDYVKVRAEVTAAGELVALKVRRKETAESQGVAETGADGASFNLGATTVLLDDNTFITDASNSELDESDINSGSVVDVSGTLTASGDLQANSVVVLDADGTTGISGESTTAGPAGFALQQNYPNPFNPTTTLQYQIQGSGPQQVLLKIFNLMGQEVATLADELKSAGEYSVAWDARDSRGRRVASGAYIALLKVGSQSQARQMLLVR